jgi:HlyD family secretion protein
VHAPQLDLERLAPQATVKNNLKGFAARIIIKEIDPRVRPGMTANLNIPVASAENVLAVPLAAVFTEQGDRYVFVKSDDKFERRSVQIGLSNNDFAEVQSGLSGGETVSLVQLADEMKNKAGKNPAEGPKATGGARKTGSATGGSGGIRPAGSGLRPSGTASH